MLSSSVLRMRETGEVIGDGRLRIRLRRRAESQHSVNQCRGPARREFRISVQAERVDDMINDGS